MPDYMLAILIVWLGLGSLLLVGCLLEDESVGWGIFLGLTWPALILFTLAKFLAREVGKLGPR